MEATLLPVAWERVTAKSSAKVTFFAANGSEVVKGTVWAVQGPDRLENDRRLLEIEQEALEGKLAEARWEAAEKREGLETSLSDLEVQHRDLTSLLEEDQQGSPAYKKSLRENIARLKVKIERLQAKLDPARLDQEVLHKQDQARLAVAQRQIDFDLSERASRLTAPFTGRLNILVQEAREQPKTGESFSAWVDAGEPIGTLADESAYEVSLPVSDPILSESPLEQLTVHLEHGAAPVVRASFQRMDEVVSGSRTRQVAVFRVIPEDAGRARQIPAEPQIVYIYRALPASCRIIRKDTLVHLAPEVLAAGGWSALVAHLWQDAKVMQVGLQTLAVSGPSSEGK
jgi:uncharacterized metal-binding protein YceD (DUF177 family)